MIVLLRAISLSGAAILFNTTALAQVEVDVPPECGSKAAFQAELERLPGYDSATLPATQVHIGLIDASIFELQVKQLGQETRTFTDANCLTLFRTAIVVTAASIPASKAAEPALTESAATSTSAADPAASAAAAPAAAPPAAATATATAAPPTATLPSPPVAPDTTLSTTPAPEQELEAQPAEPVQASLGAVQKKRDKAAWRPALGVGAGVAFGLSPQVAPLLEVMGALNLKRWGASLALRYVPPTQELTNDDLGVRVQSFGLRAAALFTPTGWLRVQAGLAVYGMLATGIGVRYPASDLVWLTTPELELAVSPVQISDFTLEFVLQGRLALNRPVFQVEPDIEVYRTPRLGAAALFRINWSPR